MIAQYVSIRIEPKLPSEFCLSISPEATSSKMDESFPVEISPIIAPTYSLTVSGLVVSQGGKLHFSSLRSTPNLDKANVSSQCSNVLLLST